MATAMTARKQRLRTLEKEIRTGMEEFYYTGMKLKEIRDDELYKEDGFDTWEDYCRKRWEMSPQHTYKLIKASEYRKDLPNVAPGATSWTEKSVRELTRIPDKKQAARVAAKVVKEVEKSQREAAKNPEAKPLKLTSSTVRKFVDQDLGVNRGQKARDTKRERANAVPSIENYLEAKIGLIAGITENLAEVAPESWEAAEASSPGIAERLAVACDDLAELLRS